MYEKFAKLLEDRGVTAYQVAKATGISPTTLSEWKNGKYVPKADKLMMIAQFFNVPLDYFYDSEVTT